MCDDKKELKTREEAYEMVSENKQFDESCDNIVGGQFICIGHDDSSQEEVLKKTSNEIDKAIFYSKYEVRFSTLKKYKEFLNSKLVEYGYKPEFEDVDDNDDKIYVKFYFNR